MNQDFVIQLNNLSCGYLRQPILRNVNVTLQKGELCLLNGQNGSGKTTLLNCITGLGRLQNGSISYFNKKIRFIRLFNLAKLGVRYLMQEPVLLENDTVEAHTNLLSKHFGVNFCSDPLFHDFFDFKTYAKIPIHKLSRGNRKRFAIALTITSKPSILIMDEPFASLDSHSSGILLEKLKIIKSQGISVLLAEHSRSEELSKITDKLWRATESTVVESPP